MRQISMFYYMPICFGFLRARARVCLLRRQIEFLDDDAFNERTDGSKSKQDQLFTKTFWCEENPLPYVNEQNHVKARRTFIWK